ncbi:hypothetical protein Ddye_003610 [Dipteronia dyeriana]|uniref:Uncharacterized protein n=1 Tax=Dipteronia dyeriana TaxID=168575 RepID=A0AAE0CVI4_9ROSI|nr:hypothetical protein Ddye_003610 [Dipteronia dyeriana]
MGSEIPQLHIFFFSFMAHGHMIPTVDMAKHFGTRGVKTSIITTLANAPLLSNTIQRSNDLGIEMDLKIIKFPCVEATTMLQEALEQLLRECKSDCLAADVFFPWTSTDVAAKFGIPS